MSRVLDAAQTILRKSGSQPTPDLSEEKLDSLETSLWAVSPEREWYIERRPKVTVAVLFGCVLAIVAGFLGEPPRTVGQSWWAVIFSSAALVVFVYCTFPYWAARMAFSERRRKTAEYAAERALRDLGQREDVPLNKLFVYNRRQLDAYQEQSRRQQRSAYRHAQAAGLAGILVLIVGILISYQQGTGTDTYVVSGLTGLGTLLSGYMGTTFLATARRADEQLNLYYKEPHMMGRLIVAERVAKTLCPADKPEEGKAMISQLLTWPLPEIPVAKNGTPDE
jgi:hypothetical protein